MKKLLFLIMVVMAASAVHAQTGFNSTTITGMQTFIGKPRNAWFPMDRGGVSYKIDINDIASNKLDTAFIRNDSFFTSKNGVLKGVPMPGGNGNGGGGGGNGSSVLSFSIQADGTQVVLPFYVGNTIVTSVQNVTDVGAHIDHYLQAPGSDTVKVYYSNAPLGYAAYQITVINP